MSHYEKFREWVLNPTEFYNNIQIEKKNAPGDLRFAICYYVEILKALDEQAEREKDSYSRLGDVLDKLNDIKEVLNQIEINTRK